LRESQPEDAIVVHTEEGSRATTVTLAAADAGSQGKNRDEHLDEDFIGIDWTRLRKYMEPIASQRSKKSWIYCYGYLVAHLKDPNQIYFVYRYCYISAYVYRR
jgi:hypothetical protein